MNYTTMPSPIGELTIISNGRGIASLHIEGDRYFAGPPAAWVNNPQDELLQRAVRELTEYFAGERKEFTVPLAPKGTAFQETVWKALLDVPSGQTSTYAEVAAKIGKPKAVRAVGTAIGRNPICILIPCHRVKAAGGGLGGFVAGLERKMALLDLESATVR